MKKSKSDIKFKGLEKKSIRNLIIAELITRKSKSFIDFWGNGEMYAMCKKAKIPIFSIDNGKDFISLPKEREALKAKLNNHKDRAYISFKQLCKQKRKDDAFWLDYCGALGQTVWKDLERIPVIMTDKGVLFITYQEGHEVGFPKGTDRRLINRYYGDATEEILEHGGIKVKKFLSYRYMSYPDYGSRRKLGGTPMVTIGYNWKKI